MGAQKRLIDVLYELVQNAQLHIESGGGRLPRLLVLVRLVPDAADEMMEDRPAPPSVAESTQAQARSDPLSVAAAAECVAGTEEELLAAQAGGTSSLASPPSP